MRRAARAVPLPAAVALALAGLLPAGTSAVSEQPPKIVPVSPVNGALLERSYVTFAWRVEWPRPPASGTVEVVHRHAADRAFTREVTTTSRVPGCPGHDGIRAGRSPAPGVESGAAGRCRGRSNQASTGCA